MATRRSTSIPKTKYIWALALAPDGTLYAGTGDDGRVFRITGAGRGEEYYATGQSNVTGLMLDAQGRLLAGTEPNGILYRITAKDKAFALYDSDLPEIRAVAPNPDGSVYAVALGGSLAKKTQAVQGAQTGQPDATPTMTTSITVTADAGGEIKPAPPDSAKTQQTAPPSATPAITAATAVAVADGTVEKSAIYRINADNTVDTLWSSKEEDVYDILPGPDGQLYFGTDSNGRIYRLSSDRKLTLVAQTNESEATRLLQWRGSVLAATANMGKIYRLGAAGASGTYESPVFDAGSAAQWGRLRWQGENGAGSVTLRTRSGNSIRPDATWSDWSDAVRDASGAQITSPNARFLQYEAKLTGAGRLSITSARLICRRIILRSCAPSLCSRRLRPRPPLPLRQSIEHGQRRDDSLQRYGHRYRRRRSRELDRHADADALARRFPAADDFLAGRRSGRRQAGL